MRERFIFTSDIERKAAKEFIQDNFPLARLVCATDALDTDFLLDMDLPIERVIFFRWAAVTHGPARLLLYSCYYLSLDLYDPPSWMTVELRRLQQRRLTDGK